MHTSPIPRPRAPLCVAQTTRIAAAILATSLFSVALHAADPAPKAAASAKASNSTGTIEGRVFNAGSGTYLNNARITVEGTSIEAFTDDSGAYILNDVPAGTVQIKASYVGQKTVTKSINVSAGSVAVANVNFGATDTNGDAKVLTLDPYVIESGRYRNADELARNEEKSSVNIKSVVAMDSLGHIVDGNVGEFVRFLPGLEVGMGSTSGVNSGQNPDNATQVSVRGFGAYETAIMIDGMPVASSSPSGLTRTIQLDGLSVNNASRLEVIKVPTPDMSSDAAGGTINLITRGAFELRKPVYTLTFALNGNTQWGLNPLEKSPGPGDKENHKVTPNIRASAEIPVTQKFGMSVSMSYDSKYSNTLRSNMRDWSFRRRTLAINGVTTPITNAKGEIGLDNPVIDRFEIYESEWKEDRKSGNLRLDYRPFRGLDLRGNVQYSTMENEGVSRRQQWRFNSGVKDWGTDYVTGFQRTSTFNPGYSNGSMTVDPRDREGHTIAGYVTAKYRRGPLSVEANASRSDSFNTLPDLQNKHFSSIDLSVPVGRMDLVGIDKGTIGELRVYDTNGNRINYGDLSVWSPFTTPGSMVRSAQSDNRDTRDQYQASAAYDFDLFRIPINVKAGWSENSQFQQRAGLGSTYRMAYTGPSVPNSQLTSAYMTEASLGYAQPQQWADGSKVFALYEAHPEYFDANFVDHTKNDATSDLTVNNYLSYIGGVKGLRTTKSALYAQAQIRLFRNRLTILGGARQETIENKGFSVFNNPNGVYVQLADGTRYRDQFYTQGVKFNGDAQAGVTGGASTARDVVLTDSALRARMTAAKVKYLPTILELAPNGASGATNNNMVLAKQNRYARNVDSSRTQPASPQVQLAYEITDTLKARVAWNRSIRQNDIEDSSGGVNGTLVGGANFQITEKDPALDGTYPDTPGAQGSIRIGNVNSIPEVNDSWNFNLAWYPKGGKYAISYYYKVSNVTWSTETLFNDDPGYDTLLDAMGLNRDQYENYSIDTLTMSGARRIRRGFEVEASQSLAVLENIQALGPVGKWLRAVDLYLTYSPRPDVITSGSASRRGWVPELPGRAQWGAGFQYNGRRFSLQARANWFEQKLSYNGNITADLKDVTGVDVQMYRLNKNPITVKMQANYILNKKVVVFVTADRMLEDITYDRTADAMTGYQPDYASYRTVSSNGVRIALGTKITF